MSELRQQHCQPCEGGQAPMTTEEAERLLSEELSSDWALTDDGKGLKRTFRFKNYYRTMAFVNAVAWIAHREDHHPDLEVGYNRCTVRYSTHAIGGLSRNDFICAARVDDLVAD